MNLQSSGLRMALKAARLYPIEPTPVIHKKRSSLGAKFCYALLLSYVVLVPWAAYLYFGSH